MDSKSIGLCPQGFESPRCRVFTQSDCESDRLCGPLRTPLSRAHTCKSCQQLKAFRQALFSWGTWCSGITSASHAEGPGLNPQCVHMLFYISPLGAVSSSRRLSLLLSNASQKHHHTCTLASAERTTTSGVWRNGSASDSRSEGWEFESLCPHFLRKPRLGGASYMKN